MLHKKQPRIVYSDYELQRLKPSLAEHLQWSFLIVTLGFFAAQAVRLIPYVASMGGQ